MLRFTIFYNVQTVMCCLKSCSPPSNDSRAGRCLACHPSSKRDLTLGALELAVNRVPHSAA